MVNQKSTDLGIPNRFKLKSSRFSPLFDAFSSCEPVSTSLENALALVHFSAFEVGLEDLGIGQVFRIAFEQIAIEDGQVG
jgi:hypothetical protein